MSGRNERAQWTAEFVYGTISVLIVIAGVEVGGRATPLGTALIILVGAGATAIAHAYASVLGQRHALGRPATRMEVVGALTGASPIVLAALPAVAVVAGSTLGIWELRAAIGFANVFGLAVLAWCGWAAARAAGLGSRSRIRSTIVTTSIGLAIIAVERVVHL